MYVNVEESFSGFEVRFGGEEFEWMLAQFKDLIPHPYRRYKADGRYWYVREEGRRFLEKWVERCQQAQEKQNRSYEPPPPRQNDDDPYAVLHLRSSAPKKLIESARKILLVSAHPDAGGSHELACKINRAADEALQRRGAA
jgi:hypothetical protein